MGSIPPPPSMFGPTSEIIAEIERLRRAIRRGALDRRNKLVHKLGELATNYSLEGKYDVAMQTIDEIIELADILIDEGQTELRLDVMLVLSQVFTSCRTTAPVYGIPFDQNALFKIYNEWVKRLYDDEFFQFREHWATNTYEYADYLHDNGSAIAAIALIDNVLERLEKLASAESLQKFTDLLPFVKGYGRRGSWKYEIGDRESALADMLIYDKLADKASNILHKRKIDLPTKDGIADGKNIVIRISSDDFENFLASVDFDENRYEKTMQLAAMFANRAEKENAFTYFDKALEIVRKTQANETFSTFTAEAEVPHQKSIVLFQYRLYEEALREIDIAIQEAKKLLQTKEEHFFDRVEGRLAEMLRSRVDTLRQLGQIEEAEKTVNEMQELHKRVPKTIAAAKAAKDRNLERANEKYAKMQPNPEQFFSAKKAKKETTPEEKKEQNALYYIGTKHNEAVAELQRAQLAIQQRRWKPALRYLYKARTVLDTPLFQSLIEARMNLYGVYVSIASCHGSLSSCTGAKEGEVEIAEKWYNRAIKKAESLIDEGKLEYRELICDLLEEKGRLASNRRQHEVALSYWEDVINRRNNLVEEYLEGLNIKRLRTSDNQRLMPAAKLLSLFKRTAKNISKELYALGRTGEAANWIKQAIEKNEYLCSLLLEKQPPLEAIILDIFYIAMLILDKQYEEADKYIETTAEKLLTASEADILVGEIAPSDKVATLDEAKKRLEQYIIVRLYEPLSHGLYYNERKNFNEAQRLYKKNKIHEALSLITSVRESAVKLQETESSDYRLIVSLWKQILTLLDETISKYKSKLAQLENREYTEDETGKNKSDIETKLFAIYDDDDDEDDDKEELPPNYFYFSPDRPLEPDEEELDKEIAKYEAEDFEDANENLKPIFQMMEEFSKGKDTTDMKRMFEELMLKNNENKSTDPAKHKTGRNDPCPCGSGKKYKKCCMDKE
ncbi:MAG: SEC-C domain-containing protein [Planctomycetaceae bacterium]|jgi:uncharacterized protein YecA (UPF0149 family)|nr:SEC-C domain-containing protein [Planctomycetaceae bacterium]